MKHPNQEEWMEFLYRETNAGRTQEMAGHLRECSSCQQTVHQWQNSMNTLDQWRLPQEQTPRKSSFFAPWVRWAAVAMICASAGFAWGRLAPRYDIQTIRAQLEQPMRQQIEQDLRQAMAEEVQEKLDESVRAARARLADELRKAQAQTFAAWAKAQADTRHMIETLSHTYATERLEDQTEIENLLARLETQRITDLRTLRKDVETLAVLTEDSLENTQKQLVRLASMANPTSPNLDSQP